MPKREMTMVERVAFAMFCKSIVVDPKYQRSVWFEDSPFGIPDEDADLPGTSALHVTAHGKSHFRTMARAAIEAMRIPTTSMEDAVAKDVDDWISEKIEDMMHLYKVAIDAALKEHEGAKS